MWVADDRVDEYLSMGHRLSEPPKPANPVKRPPKKTKTAGG